MSETTRCEFCGSAKHALPDCMVLGSEAYRRERRVGGETILCGCGCGCNARMSFSSSMEEDIAPPEDGWHSDPSYTVERVYVHVCLDCFTGSHVPRATLPSEGARP